MRDVQAWYYILLLCLRRRISAASASPRASSQLVTLLVTLPSPRPRCSSQTSQLMKATGKIEVARETCGTDRFARHASTSDVALFRTNSNPVLPDSVQPVRPSSGAENT